MSISTAIRENWDDLSATAQKHIRATRPALLNRWDCIDVGKVDTITADSAEEALDSFADTYSRDMYDCSGTVYVDIRVRNQVTHEEEIRTITLAEPEPECVDGQAHDWQSPYSLLGGLKENPGVWGSGGGVRIKKVCAHCGAYRITETCAQRHDTGEYVGAETSYELPDDDSREWVQSSRASALRADAERVLVSMDAVTEYVYGTGEVAAIVTGLAEGADREDVIEALESALPDARVYLYHGTRADGLIQIELP